MEKLMHYVWQHKLWPSTALKTVDGRKVKIIDPGLHNHNSGPDFFNAKLQIGDDTWCGNVEIHVKASDWFRHGHHCDHAYDSVVLHVVGHDDSRIQRPDGSEMPQLVMNCTPHFSSLYNEMVNNAHDLRCRAEIATLPKIYITDWISNLAFERLHQKVEHIHTLLNKSGGNWAETLYVTLARALGFGINAEPFERLALSTPLHTLMKHRDSYETVEGTLFGQAGFLTNPPDHSHYVSRMQQEYEFMCRKFNLTPPRSLSWRMSRMRPQNFPHRRIATLAAMICGGFTIASNLFNVRTQEDARRLFELELTGYWSRRYNFTANSAKSVRALSQDSITVLIINVVVPMLYAFGSIMGNQEHCTTATSLLTSLPPENNSVVKAFTSASIECHDAFTSQALIQLRRNYCEPRKCLYCRIGHRILSEKACPNNKIQAFDGSVSISSKI